MPTDFRDLLSNFGDPVMVDRGLGMTLGIVGGTVIGLLSGNVGLWIGIGVVFGIIVGVVMGNASSNQERESLEVLKRLRLRHFGTV